MSNLYVSPDAPAIVRGAANLILAAHITGGALGILSGVVVFVAPKGERLHRWAGTVFFVAMLTAYLIGAAVAPFLDEGQRTNFTAGILALYLLISGWMTVKRKTVRPGPFDIFGLVCAVAIAAAGGWFMHLAAGSATGTIDGSPPQAFVVFVVGGALAAAGDAHQILRRGLSGVERISRHLWRLGFSLFIASGSFFLGQQQVMPVGLRGSNFLLLAALAPLVMVLFWLVRVRLRQGLSARLTSATAPIDTKA